MRCYRSPWISGVQGLEPCRRNPAPRETFTRSQLAASRYVEGCWGSPYLKINKFLGCKASKFSSFLVSWFLVCLFFGVLGLLVSWFQSFFVSWFQSSTVSWFQRFKVSKFEISKFQHLKVTKIQSFNIVKFQLFKNHKQIPKFQGDRDTHFQNNQSFQISHFQQSFFL